MTEVCSEVSDAPKCELCGEPMPAGEEMFKYHGYSGPCPKPPLRTPQVSGPDFPNSPAIRASEGEA